MKTSPLRTLLLAGALLVSSISSRALPPRQHTFKGRIVAVDQAANTVTVRSAKGPVISFVWNNSTRFRNNRDRCCACVLTTDSPVKIIYRTDVGRRIIRSAEVHLES